MSIRSKIHYYSVVTALSLAFSLTGCGGRIMVSEDTFDCSPEQPKGICPSGYTCINGACEADYQPCSAAYPHGVCESGSCVNGVCKENGTDNGACSPTNPDGWCQNGSICKNGSCQEQNPAEACSQENLNGWCNSGYCCTNGSCWPCDDDCSIAHPAGRCPNGQICEDGTCKDSSTVANKCGLSSCDGLCEYAQDCISGLDNKCGCQAATPPNSCSKDNPAGNCPDGQWCLAGKCQTIDDSAACGKNCGGVCPGHAYCVPNEKGCSCQEDVGELACGSANPTGLCADGLVCEAGICVTPSCSSTYLWGSCPAGQSCVKGKCVDGGDQCSASNPDGVCGDICEGDDCYEAVCSNGVCVAATCSAEHLRGRCGGECLICHEGSCITPTCSKQYACGVCPSCQVCNDDETSGDYGTCGPASCSLACPQGGCDSAREICASSGYCEVPSCSVSYPWGDCRTGMYCEQDKGLCENLLTPEECSLEVSCTWSEELSECIRKNYGKCTLQECNAELGVSNLVCNNEACNVLTDAAACANGPKCTWGRCEGSGTCPTIKDKDDCDENSNCWWQIGCFDARVCQDGYCTSPVCSKLFPTGTCEDGLTCYDGTCIKIGCKDDSECNPLSERCEDLPIGAKGCVEQPCSVEKPAGSCLLLGSEYFGEICDQGNCVVPSCSETYPGGSCSDEVCSQAADEAACGAAASHCRWREGCVARPGHLGPSDESVDCTINNAKDSCEAVPGCEWQGCVDGRICAGGNCLLPPCSESVPDGSCPSGMSCEAGTCVLQNCGPVNPVGACECTDLNQADCNDEIIGLGCKWDNNQCVDDDNATGFRICRNGVCQPFVCGEIFGIAPCLQSGSICGLPGSSNQCLADDPGHGNGVSTPCCFVPSCCETYPSGACAGSSERCSGGTCVLKPCSPEAPEGACGANRVCDSDEQSVTFGTCIMAACSEDNPGGHCDCAAITSQADCQNGVTGFGCKWSNGSCVDDPDSSDIRKCISGVCKPYLCGRDFPSAPCAEAGAVCDTIKHGESCLNANGDGVNSVCCYVPVCSVDYPSGSCGDGFICNNGTCQQLPCSASNPAGACGAGKICENGTCVSAPCSPEVPKGICSCSSITSAAACNNTGASYGCIWSNGACVDDPASSASISCLNGECVPYLCRAEFPNAPCTSSGYVCKIPVGDEVCEGTNSGSNGACCVKPACSSDFPGGACPDGQSCSNGTCVDLPCSAVNQNGACGAGKVCDKGTCVTAPCSAEAPNGTCASASQRCSNGVCKDYLCSVDFPSASCAEEGAVCGALVDATKESCLSGGNGTSAADPCCFKPVCSASYTSGSCEDSYICKNGICTQLPCSAANKNGACGSGQQCNNGVCEAIPCSNENPTGPCADSNQRCVNGVCKDYLCGADFPNAPCAESGTVCGKLVDKTHEQCVSGGNGTTTNCCFKPSCSATYPSGFCEDGYICKNGTCSQLPCSSANKNGSCASGQYCNNGVCETIACSEENPTGPCADSNQRCVNGVCKDYLCGADFPNAPCAQSGTVCGKLADKAHEKCLSGGDGTATNCCFEPRCSTTYPSGSCDDGFICKSGTCTQLPCSATNKNGACAAGQRCVEGACQQMACSAEAPSGTCYCSDITTQAACQNATTGFGCKWEGGACIDDPDSGLFQRCNNGVCTPYLCGATFGNAPCEDGAAVCGVKTAKDSCIDGGVGTAASPCCFKPVCSPSYPGGSCEEGYICQNGTCTQLPCSQNAPNGACGANQRCVEGSCQAAPCSAEALNGTCLCADIETEAACKNAGTGFGCVWNGTACTDDPTSAFYQKCVNGVCTPYLCGADFTSGPCENSDAICGVPTGADKCLDSSITNPSAQSPCCFVPHCSATYKSGTCDDGYICQDGTCTLLPCSAAVPNGSCPSGQECSAGACIKSVCSASATDGRCECSDITTQAACQNATSGFGCKWSNGKCIDDSTSTNSQRCLNGSCAPYLCSADFPNAPCAISGTVCGKPVNGESCADGGSSAVACCYVPKCSVTYPGGACAAGQYCSGGSCVDYPCSASNPTGACAASQVCNNGTCELAKCSVSAPNGTCYCADITSQAACQNATTGFGCKWNGSACIDDPDKVDSMSCANGTCAPYLCSADFPTAPCAESGAVCGKLIDKSKETCLSGGDGTNANCCFKPWCSATYPSGQCQDGYVCSNGICTQLPCSVSNPIGSCASGQYCDGGVCTRYACSDTYPSGTCESGKVCEKDGGAAHYSCSAPDCSVNYPFGECHTAGTTCVGGTCSPICGNGSNGTSVTGYCSGGLACVMGACTNACEDDYDCDGIPNSIEGNDTIDTDKDGIPDSRDLDSDGDGIPDSVEAGADPTHPLDTDGDGIYDFREIDSDGDGINDSIEVGPVPTQPLDSDGDGIPDYRDFDSDGDGIYDKFEGAGDVDGDGIPNYLDIDADGDGIPDAIEARPVPYDENSFKAGDTPADHDDDGIYDFLDPDSDNDGVLDADEDVNGNGIVDCQYNGRNEVVYVCSEIENEDVCDAHGCIWDSNNKVCNDSAKGCSKGLCEVNEYNPGCQDVTARCILAETSRIHKDSDCDGMGDGNDGLYLACAADNLKPINLFYDREADIAMALEQAFDEASKFSSGNYRGITFDASNSSAAYGVSGFILAKAPAAAALAVSEPRQKVIKQEEYDRGLLTSLSPSVVISRYSETFDGFATSIFRYTITSSGTVSNARNAVLKALAGGTTISAPNSYGPTDTAYTLIIQTIYRYDDGNTGRVLLLGAIVPTDRYASCGANADSTSCGKLASCNWSNNKCVEYDCRAASSSGACNSTHCVWNTIDETCDNKQLPLFYVNNVTSGSTVTQFGDDLDKLCQSFNQKSGKVDFLWLLDFSNSIEPARTQIKNSASTFFDLLNNTEADYRAAQTGAHTFDDNISNYNASGEYFTMYYGYYRNSPANTPWPPNYDFRACASLDNTWVGANGCLIDQFTGSLVFSDERENRDFEWDCSSSIKGPGCDTAYTCAACNGSKTGKIYAPECYFASRMVCDASVGNSETPLLMAEWALYRYLDKHICGDAFDDGSIPDATTCSSRDGCFWDDGECVPSNCAIAKTQKECESSVEDGGIKIIGCLWNTTTKKCVPNFSCEATPDSGAGTAKQRCESLNQNNCKLASPICTWTGSACTWSVCSDNSKDLPLATYYRCPTAKTQNACEQNNTCVWEDGKCRAIPLERMRTDATPIIVAVTDEEECFLKDSRGYLGNGNGTQLSYSCGSTSSTNKEMVKFTTKSCSNFSNQNDCTAKNCTWTSRWGGGTCSGTWKETIINEATSYGYNWYDTTSKGYAVREARQESFARFFQSRGTLVFTLTGEKATTSTNGGCGANGISAEPGNALISVAESTGGGWGSVCASNVYPAVESIIINSLAKSSAYKLEASIDGKKVQPIGSTIKVVAEVCTDDSSMTFMNYSGRCNQKDEYSCRANGCKWSGSSCSGCNNRVAKVIPMSRENGFDYDALNNTITLFGNARPARGRDIVVSFRYWINNPQLPEGPAINTCSCPGTSECSELTTQSACAAHSTCTWSGGKCSGEYATDCSVLTTSAQCGSDSRCEWSGTACNFKCGCEGGAICGGSTCESQSSEAACKAAVGCAWADGLCMSTGICTIDPTCGGTCNEFQTCNSNTGICECNKDCNNACGAGEFCNFNQECEGVGGEEACRAIESQGVCEWRTDALLCEDGDCGKCACDTSCGGCAKGTICDDDEKSNSCGQCLCDTTCSYTNCAIDCATVNTKVSCESYNSCGWQNNKCVQTAYTECDSSTASSSCGFCVVDSDCSLHPCSTGEVCNPSTGMCECDTSCGGGCKAGFACDADTGSATCGSCKCDTTCGGETPPAGQKCDTNTSSPTCGLFICDTTCGGGCSNSLVCDNDGDSPTCGQCVCDTTCGGKTPNIGMKCDDNTNSTTCGQIVCGAACNGGCTAGFTCDENRGECGECVCDTTCGGSCPDGQKCDANGSSATCGQCVCDTTCGGSCPANYKCDNKTSSATCGQCLCDTTCGGKTPGTGKKCDDNSASATCGQIVCDTTCNGGCLSSQKCDVNSTSATCGQCICDTTCGGATPGKGMKCDSDSNSATCGQLVCDTTCGGVTPAVGTKCDANTTSATCGQIVCDTECGNRCSGEKVCDSSVTSSTCGTCICGDACGGNCPVGQTCDENRGDCGECVCDTTCGGGTCPTGQKCDSNAGSQTCGSCICDTTCGGVKPGKGMKCDNNTSSATCGQIVCDTTCANAGSSPTDGQSCDTNTASETCGTYVCGTPCGGDCPGGQTCDENQGCGKCVCDTTCGGGKCPDGQKCDSSTVSSTCGSCICDTTCGGVQPSTGMKCDTNLSSSTCGQIVCDTTCGGACGSTKSCDDNVNSATCGQCVCPEHDDTNTPVGQKWDEKAGECGGYVCDTTCKNACTTGQKCDSDAGSSTCGSCICDTTCGGVKPGQGMKCDSNPSSSTCGQIVCDTTCNGGCTAGKSCDDNINSASCGQCVCPEGDDSSCLASQKWQAASGATCGSCVCDTTCKNSCTTGQKCDADTASGTCGQCVCDTACTGQVIGKGQKCDNNTASNTCGQPICDQTCGGSCADGYTCDTNTSSSTCGQCICAPGSDDSCLAGQKWDAKVGECGGCVCDTTCGGDCLGGQKCDTNTASDTCGQCICDTTCGGSCGENWSCDSDTSSPTCGQCKCDTTCGGGKCSGGLVCDDNSASQTCGQCICDQTCGGSCPAGQSCDQNLASGTCGQCICDTTCGGSCPTGQICDGNLSSDTCGLCACDTTCGYANGAAIPAGKSCDSNPASATCGQLICDTTCGGVNPGDGFKCDSNSASPTCGQIICDTTCGGSCLSGQSCDSDVSSQTCGQCICDTTCGDSCMNYSNQAACSADSGCEWSSGFCLSKNNVCPAGQQCDNDVLSGFCGQCVCDTTCGGVEVAEGRKCDGDVNSATCGQVLCDTSCGGPCATGTTCDTNSNSNTCGQCICDQTCGGLCTGGSGQTCDSDLDSPTCGQCLCDNTCGGSCPSGQCCDGNDQCVGLSISECNNTNGCVYRDAIGACESLTCGQCQVDSTCCNCQDLPAGQTSCCASGTTCNANTGLCEVNSDCCAHIPDAQRDQYKCNTFTGQCIFIAG